MTKSQNCVFDVVSVDGSLAVVACVRCGLKAKVPIENALSKLVYSACRVPPDGTPPPERHGPGTELSRLLKRFGIEPTPTCQCRAKAAQMDAWGPDECERPERIDEVVAVMRAEAAARGLPFVDAVGRMLVRRAIANARRNRPVT